MKHRHLIALLQEGYTTIQVVFNDDVRGRSKPYTYKAPLSAGVEVGDRVVVDSPSKGLVVVEVVGTDKAPRIDLDADFTYKWIVQKVELKAYEEQLEREAALMEKLEAAEKSDAESIAIHRNARDERDALRAENAALVDDMNLLRNNNTALRSKIEAAENDAAHQKALAASALRVAEGWERKCGELRAKIEQMERQEPVGTLHDDGCFVWRETAPHQSNYAGWKMALYALPGAQAQPAKNAVAYLDLGTGGYMDVGTDLTDEELATLPKGRHMLGIIGTYGVDGYVPAQRAAGW